MIYHCHSLLLNNVTFRREKEWILSNMNWVIHTSGIITLLSYLSLQKTLTKWIQSNSMLILISRVVLSEEVSVGINIITMNQERPSPSSKWICLLQHFNNNNNKRLTNLWTQREAFWFKDCATTVTSDEVFLRIFLPHGQWHRKSMPSDHLRYVHHAVESAL